MSPGGCPSRWSLITIASKQRLPATGTCGLLESALARPRNFFGFGEEDIIVLAVVLMAGIARAHAFEQANKRTAFEAMWHFLRLNGYDLAIEDATRWADEVVALVEHRSTEENFTRAIRPYVIPS